MSLEKRILAFVRLGDLLNKDFCNKYEVLIDKVIESNSWFTKKNIDNALLVWAHQLRHELLSAWLDPYKISEPRSPKCIAVIMAGNIPLVGFHDFLSVILSGNKAVIKMSRDDNVLLPLIIHELIAIEPSLNKQISFIDKFNTEKYDAVIATGSENTSLYFESYFKGLRKIIRKTRSSVAILNGNESVLELEKLAYDVFAYFGLGCRSVSKLFVPEGFNLDHLFNAFSSYDYLMKHKKYANNYHYNKAVSLMQNDQFIDNNFLLLKKEEAFSSPIAMLYYEYYNDMSLVENILKKCSSQIQCIVSNRHIGFGESQTPDLWEYADGVDTIQFLRSL